MAKTFRNVRSPARKAERPVKASKKPGVSLPNILPLARQEPSHQLHHPSRPSGVLFLKPGQERKLRQVHQKGILSIAADDSQVNVPRMVRCAFTAIPA